MTCTKWTVLARPGDCHARCAENGLVRCSNRAPSLWPMGIFAGLLKSAPRASHFHGRMPRQLGGARGLNGVNRTISAIIMTPVPLGARVRVHELGLPLGNHPREETIDRSCLLLLLGVLASMGQDVCRRDISVVWASCGDWTC